MLARLSSVAKDGLATQKKSDQAEQRRERRDVAQLAAQPGDRARSVVAADRFRVHASRRRQQAVLADRLARRIRGTISPLFITRMRSASDSTVSGSVETTTIADALVAQAAHDPHHVVLGADIHAARRLAQHQHLGQIGQPFRRAPPSAGCRPTARRAARSTVGRADAAALSTCRAGDARAPAPGCSQSRRDALEDAIETFL